MGRDLEGWFERYRRRGDLRALSRVFDATARDLLGLAQHLVRDADEAEDLVQSTFVTAIDRAASWDRDRPLRPWLSGILAHKASNLRRERARRAADEDAGALLPFPGREPVPSAGAEAAELDAALTGALARLGAPYREVLEAHLVDGERPEEIARRLDRAPGTVRAQIYRGLERLRRLLPAGAGAAIGWGSIGWGALGAAREGLVTLPRGLDVVRRAVLDHGASAALAAPAAAAATTTGAAASLAIGGGVMLGKKAALAGAAIVLASVGYLVADTHTPEVPRPTAPEVRAAAAPDVRLVPGVDGPVEAAPSAAEAPADEPAVRAAAARGRLLVRVELPTIAEDHRGEVELALTRGVDLDAEDRHDLTRLGDLELVQQIVEQSVVFEVARPRGESWSALPRSPGAVGPGDRDGDGARIPLDLGRIAMAMLVPDRVTLLEGGVWEVELTRAVAEADTDEVLELELTALHPLYFDDAAGLEVGPDDRERLERGEDVLHELQLAPRPAAVLAGTIAREGVPVTAGTVVHRELDLATFAGIDTGSGSSTDATEASAILDVRVSSGEELILMSGEGGLSRFVVHFTTFAPAQVALVRPGADSPTATTEIWSDDFEFKVEEDGEYRLVVMQDGRPPVTVPVELRLAERVELEEPVALPEGPTVEGVVEDRGAFPAGGLDLVARRAPRADERPLDWDHHALVWTRGDVARAEAVTRTEADGTFRFEGLSPGDHEVEIDARERVVLGEVDAAATRVTTPVPATGLQLLVPAAVVELEVRPPAGWAPGEDGPPDVRVEVIDPASAGRLGEATLDGEARLDLVLRPGQQVALRLAAQGWSFEEREVTAPERGRTRVTVDAELADG